MSKPFPTWRQIEQVLVELLREEGLAIDYFKGESFTTIGVGEDAFDIVEINIGDFARAIADRL